MGRGSDVFWTDIILVVDLEGISILAWRGIS